MDYRYIIYFTLILILIPFTFATTGRQYHPANEISAGTFGLIGTDSFAFPQYLNVTNDLRVGGQVGIISGLSEHYGLTIEPPDTTTARAAIKIEKKDYDGAEDTTAYGAHITGSDMTGAGTHSSYGVYIIGGNATSGGSTAALYLRDYPSATDASKYAIFSDSGDVAFESAGMCIGSGACTVPSSNGDLLVEEILEVGTQINIPSGGYATGGGISLYSSGNIKTKNNLTVEGYVTAGSSDSFALNVEGANADTTMGGVLVTSPKYSSAVNTIGYGILVYGPNFTGGGTHTTYGLRAIGGNATSGGTSVAILAEAGESVPSTDSYALQTKGVSYMENSLGLKMKPAGSEILRVNSSFVGSSPFAGIHIYPITKSYGSDIDIYGLKVEASNAEGAGTHNSYGIYVEGGNSTSGGKTTALYTKEFAGDTSANNYAIESEGNVLINATANADTWATKIINNDTIVYLGRRDGGVASGITAFSGSTLTSNYAGIFNGPVRINDKLEIRNGNISGNVTITEDLTVLGCMGSVYVGNTTTIYNGNAGWDVEANNASYTSADKLCNNQYPGSHICSAQEILNSRRCGVSFSANPITVEAWVVSGVGSTDSSGTRINDCWGFRLNPGTDESNFGGTTFQLNADNLRPDWDTCDQYHPFACCK